jgi:hypothetical protein
MAKVSQALMDKLKGQVAGMKGGVVIDNRSLTKMRCRLLPCFEELPGVEYVSLYYVPGKKSTTSPKTYGLPDPVVDLMDEARREKSKEEMEAINKVVRIQREYWCPVIDRANPGTPENPNVRVLRCKPKYVYQPIVDYMIDEDDGEDITDPVEGRDLRVKKEGKELNTEWSVKFLDKSPLHDDEEMVKALVEAAKTFDVRRYFFAVDKDLIQQIYMHLTGESVPEKYMVAFDEIPKLGTKSADEDDESDPDDQPAAETAEDDDSTPAAETSEDEGVELEKGTLVKFVYEDNEVIGEVQKTGVDDEGDNVADVIVANVDGVEDGTIFTVGIDVLEVVEPEPEPETKKPVVKKPTVKAGKPKAGKTAGTKAKPSAANTLKAKIGKKK